MFYSAYFTSLQTPVMRKQSPNIFFPRLRRACKSQPTVALSTKTIFRLIAICIFLTPIQRAEHEIFTNFYAMTRVNSNAAKRFLLQYQVTTWELLQKMSNPSILAAKWFSETNVFNLNELAILHLINVLFLKSCT